MTRIPMYVCMYECMYMCMRLSLSLFSFQDHLLIHTYIHTHEIFGFEVLNRYLGVGPFSARSTTYTYIHEITCFE
jgi:hypothetical protein